MRTDLTFLEGQCVTCAISGGADSVALLHLLCQAKEQLHITLAAAHFHHGLRKSADDDEAFVRELCQTWNIPLAVGRGDAADSAKAWGMSVEEAARKLRYEFLLQQPGLIAVAHHADDQAETVLLNLLRGTGLKGLCGMQRQSGRIVRPLLGVSRDEIEAYVLENGLRFCTDETNLCDEALRNRLRHHVIPALKAENPAFLQAVERMTALMREDEDYLQQRTNILLEEARLGNGYDCRVLRESKLCKRAIRQLLTIPKPSMTHVEAVCSLMEHTEGTKTVHLPGITVRREYNLLIFAPEIVCVPEAVTVTADRGGSLQWGSWQICWEEDACGGAFTVRSRQRGDSVRLHGLRKTVKKLMIDKKIPAAVRDAVPVIVKDSEIVAVGNLINTEPKIKLEERER